MLDVVVPAAIAILTLVGIGIYVREIWIGERTPYLLAWVIRTTLCGLLFAALLNKGANLSSLVLWIAQLAGCVGIIAVVVLKQGRSGRLLSTDPLALSVDVIAIGLTCAGILAWLMSGNAIYSVICVISAETVATAIGVYAAVRDGLLESTTFWFLASFAAGLALIPAYQQASFAVILSAWFSVGNALTNLVAVPWATKQRSVPAVAAAA